MSHESRLRKLLARWLHPWHWPAVANVKVERGDGGLKAVLEFDTTKYMGMAGCHFTISVNYLELAAVCQPINYVPLERLIPFLSDRGLIDPVDQYVLTAIAVQLPGEGLQRDERIEKFLTRLFEKHAGWMALWVPDNEIDDPEANLMFTIWGDHDPGSTIDSEPPLDLTVRFNGLTADMESSDDWIEAIKADPRGGLYDYVSSLTSLIQTVQVAEQTYAQRCVETMTRSSIWDGLEIVPAAAKLVHQIRNQHGQQLPQYPEQPVQEQHA